MKKENRLCSKCGKKLRIGKTGDSYGTDGKSNWWHFGCLYEKDNNSNNTIKEIK